MRFRKADFLIKEGHLRRDVFERLTQRDSPSFGWEIDITPPEGRGFDCLLQIIVEHYRVKIGLSFVILRIPR